MKLHVNGRNRHQGVMIVDGWSAISGAEMVEPPGGEAQLELD